jgi:hypothetical protein
VQRPGASPATGQAVTHTVCGAAAVHLLGVSALPVDNLAASNVLLVGTNVGWTVANRTAMPF